MNNDINKHVDTNTLHELKEVMGEDYVTLLETFVGDAQVRLEELNASVNKMDAEAIRQASHAFKGSCANIGAVCLADLCRQAEKMGREAQLQNIQPLVDQIKQEYSVVHAILTAELNSNP